MDSEQVGWKPLSIEDAREALGDEAQGLTDAEVAEIRDHANEMAAIIVPMALSLRRAADATLEKTVHAAMHPASRE